MTGKPDSAIAYERFAKAFSEARSMTGANTVRRWADTLPPASRILELGCGNGIPVTGALVAAGHTIHAIDASPTLLGWFRQRFPDIETRCENVLHSDFFGKEFDAVVAVGLVFLLEPEQQKQLITAVSDCLLPDGRFLFTAPWQTGEWRDLVTGNVCHSQGLSQYRQAIEKAGLELTDRLQDSGGTHYYDTRKQTVQR